KRYFLFIVDDYSRRVWVYIIRFKHKVFGKFKEWKQLVENQTGRTVKKLRMDNGLKFCNREFEQLCTENGIARHLTGVRTSQQNGLANAEATCTTAYLINRLPSTTIEKKTPMEMWSGHPSDYEMLRIFGCVTYSHVKQVTSRNMVCNESVMYKDTLKDSGVSVDKSVEELQIEVELQGFNNRMLEKDHIDQEDGDDEDVRDHETNQTLDLTNYPLVRDRELRIRTKPLRFQDESNMVAYTFATVEEEDTHEPLTYQEIKKGIEGVQKPRCKARLMARRFTQRSMVDIGSTKSSLKKEFDIKELGEAKKILGIEIVKDWSRKIMRVSQS
nr:hypothetical protein [Tanacetum cinerariifolium]